MKKLNMVLGMAAGALILAVPIFSETENSQGQGQAIVTVLSRQNREAPVNITTQDLLVKLNGKESSVTNWVPLRGPDDRLELVLLLDSSVRASIGAQFGDIASFIQSLPASTKVAVGYMENGNAVLAGPLTADHAQAARGLHLPVGLPSSSGGPYFCLSNLAQHWPSADRAARHEVLLITDGVDTYNRRYDPDDPYVQASINDAVRAGLVVYSIYWTDQGRAANSLDMSDNGQSLMNEVTQATGGNSYWEGSGNPVSLRPYFEDLSLRLQNQFRLSFASRFNGKPKIESLALKVGGPAAKVYAPQQVFVSPAGKAGE